MKRRLFTILSAASLVLCVACLLMWIRGGFGQDILESRNSYGGSVNWSFARGTVHLEMQYLLFGLPGEPGREVVVRDPGQLPAPYRALWAAGAPPWAFRSNPEPRGPHWRWTWPSYRTYHAPLEIGGTTVSHELTMPFWLLTLSTAMLPAIWTWKYWKARKSRKVGLCRVCGYDLRASKDRCPECGTPIPPTAEGRG